MTTDLVKFDAVRAAIAKYKIENEKLVFNYEDPNGNKEARSHIFKLRKIKTNINEIHKATKAEALSVCQAIDAEKRTLIADVEEMIEVHATPIKEIEQREENARLAKLKAEEEAKAVEEERKRKEIEEREAELAQKAADLQAKENKAKAKEEQLIRDKEKFEAEKRAEAEAKQREEKVRKQAEIDKKEALVKTARDKKEALAKAERDRKEAIKTEQEKALKEAETKKEIELQRIEAEKIKETKLREIEQKRVENETHRVEIRARISTFLFAIIQDKTLTCEVIDAIDAGSIPNVTINY